MKDTPELKHFSMIAIMTMIAKQNLNDLERFLKLNTVYPESPRYSSQIYFDFLCCLIDLETVLLSKKNGEVDYKEMRERYDAAKELIEEGREEAMMLD